jgi:hypothetical protein
MNATLKVTNPADHHIDVASISLDPGQHVDFVLPIEYEEEIESAKLNLIGFGLDVELRAIE